MNLNDIEVHKKHARQNTNHVSAKTHASSKQVNSNYERMSTYDHIGSSLQPCMMLMDQRVVSAMEFLYTDDCIVRLYNCLPIPSTAYEN